MQESLHNFQRDLQQKTFVTRSQFRPLRGWRVGVWLNSLKKENSRQKSFFQIILKKVLKICEKWKMTYHTILCKKYLQNLKRNVKRGCIFHLILVGIPLSIKSRGVRGLLNWQDSLALTKIICWQSLMTFDLLS